MTGIVDNYRTIDNNRKILTFTATDTHLCIKTFIRTHFLENRISENDTMQIPVKKPS